MRLIDADDRIDFIKNSYCLECDNYNGVRCRACPINDTIEEIDNSPTVDLWHYPSKGEYPTEKELVLMKIPGCYVLGWYDAGNWFIDDGELTVLKCNVSRWQYIIPPKEEK